MGSLKRQEAMKSWRRGFIRCSKREEPCGSHHDEARALKCDTSVGSTVELDEGEGLWCRVVVVVNARRVVMDFRDASKTLNL